MTPYWLVFSYMFVRSVMLHVVMLMELSLAILCLLDRLARVKAYKDKYYSPSTDKPPEGVQISWEWVKAHIWDVGW